MDGASQPLYLSYISIMLSCCGRRIWQVEFVRFFATFCCSKATENDEEVVVSTRHNFSWVHALDHRRCIWVGGSKLWHVNFYKQNMTWMHLLLMSVAQTDNHQVGYKDLQVCPLDWGLSPLMKSHSPRQSYYGNFFLIHLQGQAPSPIPLYYHCWILGRLLQLRIQKLWSFVEAMVG